MNEDILAVCMPVSKENENSSNEIEVDFLFQSDNYKTISIDSALQLELFKYDIDDITLEKTKGKIYHHIDHIKSYLQQNFKSLSERLDLDKFNPNNQFDLYAILAKYGIITLINSSYASLLFLPKKLSQNQKKSLIEIQNLINSDAKFSLVTIGDIPIENINYDEILKYLELKSNERRL